MFNSSQKHLKDIFSNIGWLSGLHFFKIVTSFFVGIYVTRYLGDEKLGLLGYAITMTNLLIPLTIHGIGNLFIRELRMRPDESGQIISSAWLLKMIATGITYSLFCIVMFIWWRHEEYFWLTITVSASILFFPFNVIEHWFMSHSNARPIVLIKAIVFVAALAARLFGVFSTAGVYFFGVIYAIESACNHLLPLMLIHRYKVSVSLPTRKWFFYFLRYSYQLILTNISGTLERQVDKIMIFHMLGSGMLGQYELMMRLVNMVAHFTAPLKVSLLPNLVDAHKNDKKLFYNKMKKLFFIILIIPSIISVCSFFFSEYFIVLFYSDKFEIAAKLFPYFSGYFILIFLIIWVSIYIDCLRFYKFWIISAPITMGLNLLFNWFMIPVLGIKGAIIATQLSMLISFFVMGMYFEKTRRLYLSLFQKANL